MSEEKIVQKRMLELQKKHALKQIENANKILQKFEGISERSLPADEFWKKQTAKQNKELFTKYLNGEITELPKSLYDIDYNRIISPNLISPEESSSLLNQLKNPVTGKVVDEAEAKKIINKFIKQKTHIPQHGQAQYAEFLLTQLIGEIADREMASELGDNFTISSENLSKMKERQLKGISNLKKALSLDPAISHEIPPSSSTGIYHHGKGYINLNPVFSIDEKDPDRLKSLRNLGKGVFFHEGAHDLDEISTRIAILRNELAFKNNPLPITSYSPENRGMAQAIRQKIQTYPSGSKIIEGILEEADKFEKANPGKIDTDPSILTFDSSEVLDTKNIAKVIQEKPDITPLDLQDIYNRGPKRSHFFNRNFAWESLMKALKEGIPGIKSVFPAAALSKGLLTKIGAGLATGGASTAADAATELLTDVKSTGPQEGTPEFYYEGEDPELKKLAEQKVKRYKARAAAEEALQPSFRPYNPALENELPENIDEIEKTQDALERERKITEAMKAGKLRSNYVEASPEDSDYEKFMSTIESLKDPENSDLFRILRDKLKPM